MHLHGSSATAFAQHEQAGAKLRDAPECERSVVTMTTVQLEPLAGSAPKLKSGLFIFFSHPSILPWNGVCALFALLQEALSGTEGGGRMLH